MRGQFLERLWVVLLEAAGDTSGPALSQDKLRALMEAMACEGIVGLHDPFRYGLQLPIVSLSPAEAVFCAAARWSDAVRRLGLDRWTLVRAEVVTIEEFDRESATAGTKTGPAAPQLCGVGDDLLRSVFFDPLTGFPTLALFRDRAQGIVASSASSGRGLALLVVDVDRLGSLNHELGFVYGDQVLVELAGRLALLANSTGIAARLAGDEFLLLLDYTHGSAAEVAQHVVDAIRAPIAVKGRQVVVTASVGMAAVTANSDLDEEFSRAGTAMCAAKDAGGDRFQWWEAGLVGDRARLDLLALRVPDRLAYVRLLERAALAANESSTLEEASAIVLHQVLAHTGWQAGRLWLADGSRARLEPTGVSRASGPHSLARFRCRAGDASIEAGDGLLGDVLKTGKPRWSTFVNAPGSAPPDTREAGLRSAVAFPVLCGTDVVAVLEFFSSRPISPDDSLLEVMVAVGAQLARIYERARAAEALARSEERYRMLADSLPELVWAAGPDGTCQFVNRRWLEFTGRTFEEDTGDSWVELVHPDDRGSCMSGFRQAFDSRQPFELEYRLRRADGEYRWLLDRGNPVFENGVVTGYVGSCIDVTDRRWAESELHNEDIRFRALVQDADTMVIVIGADGSVIDDFVPTSNLGYQTGDERGRLGLGNVHPDDRQRAKDEFDKALAHRGPGGPFECRVRHRDGSWRWLQATANNLLDDPWVRGIVYTARDITDQKLLAEKLHATEQRLEQVEQRLRQMERLQTRDRAGIQ